MPVISRQLVGAAGEIQIAELAALSLRIVHQSL